MRLNTFGHLLDIKSCLGHLSAVTQCFVRASYEVLYTRQFTIGAKQGLTNQCRGEGLGHFFFAAHGRNRFRPIRRGIAVWRRATTVCIPPQRRLSPTRLSLLAHGCGAYRGHGGSPGRQHTNDRAMKMADNQVTHPFRRTKAQSAQKSRDHHNQKQTSQVATADSAVLARHRRAHAQIRGSKAAARRREYEEEKVTRHAGNTERTGSGTGDHREGVA